MAMPRVLVVVLSGWLLGAQPACAQAGGARGCLSRPGASVALAVGDSATRIVWACDRTNRTGIQLVGGAEYHVRARGKWMDDVIPSGAEGYVASAAPRFAWVLRLAQPFRRVSSARWFELIGEVPPKDGSYMRIGSRADTTWIPKVSGELAAFANDVSVKYGNNKDSVVLIVVRVK